MVLNNIRFIFLPLMSAVEVIESVPVRLCVRLSEPSHLNWLAQQYPLIMAKALYLWDAGGTKCINAGEFSFGFRKSNFKPLKTLIYQCRSAG